MNSNELALCAVHQGFFDEMIDTARLADKGGMFSDMYKSKAVSLLNELLIDFINILDEELEKERAR